MQCIGLTRCKFFILSKAKPKQLSCHMIFSFLICSAPSQTSAELPTFRRFTLTFLRAYCIIHFACWAAECITDTDSLCCWILACGSPGLSKRSFPAGDTQAILLASVYYPCLGTCRTIKTKHLSWIWSSSGKGLVTPKSTMLSPHNLLEFYLTRYYYRCKLCTPFQGKKTEFGQEVSINLLFLKCSLQSHPQN